MLQPELETGETNRQPEGVSAQELELARVAAEHLLHGQDAAELARQGLQDEKIIAVDTLLESRHRVQTKYGLEEITWDPPSPNKYPDWFKWDQAFVCKMFFETAEYCWSQAAFYESQLKQLPPHEHIEVNAVLANFRQRADIYFRSGVEGLTTSFAGMDETGNMPNSRVLTKSGMIQAGLERKHVRKNGGKSLYTQPVLEPTAILAGCRAAEAADPSGRQTQELLAKFYEPAKLHLSFIKQFLSDGKYSRLAGVPHAHATGRDSDFTLKDSESKRIPRKGHETPKLVDLANAVIDYREALKRSKEIAEASGDMSRLREQYWHRDVMFNCIYLQSLYQMAELAQLAGKTKDVNQFLNLAEELETEMQTLWEPDAWQGNGAFINLDKNRQPVRGVSVGNLGAFMMPDLSQDQLASMIKMAWQSFDAPYGIPCTPTDGHNAGEHKWEIERIWNDDSSWDSANSLILDAMIMHAEREDLPPWLRRSIAKFAIKADLSSNDALNKYFPPSEYRSSQTGKPRRKRVTPFAWGMLPRYMKAYERLNNLLSAEDLQELVNKYGVRKLGPQPQPAGV